MQWLIRHLCYKLCSAVDSLLDTLWIRPAEFGEPGVCEQQIRIGRDGLSREHAETAFEELPPFGIHQDMAVVCHQADSRRDVMPQQRVLQRLLERALSGEPGAGPGVKLRDFVRFVSLRQPALQETAEEMMVAIPAALVIQGHSEQIVLLQPLQGSLATHLNVIAAEQGCAQRAAHPVEDRGLQEKVLDGGRSL